LPTISSTTRDDDAHRGPQQPCGNATLLENATVLFTPTADFNGDAWFEYQADDVMEEHLARATLVYQRSTTCRWHATTATPVYPAILHSLEDHAIEIPIIELLKNDFDVEGFRSGSRAPATRSMAISR